MVERERLGRRRVEDEPRREQAATMPQHALLALQRSAGNQAVARMLQRQHDPDFAYGPGTAEAISVSNQTEMNDAVEELIDDRYGGYRNLFMQNDVATSVGAWRDLIFSYMQETYELHGVGRAEVLSAVKWVKDKFRAESLLHMANVHVFWMPPPPQGPPWSGADLKERMEEAGAYLDADDDEALDAIFETEGKFAKTKVDVPAGNLELIDADNVVVLIDDHQQKHQTEKIPQFKAYTGDPGTKFADGKGLEWHRANTARQVKRTVEDAVRTTQVTTTTSYAPAKDAINGIIYDLLISYDDATGKYVGSYHCNPVVDEFHD
jgi:hypothetical protein